MRRWRSSGLPTRLARPTPRRIEATARLAAFWKEREAIERAWKVSAAEILEKERRIAEIISRIQTLLTKKP